MFMGEYVHSVDEKGRSIIPSKYRDELGNSFIITAGLDGCLFGYPEEAWKEFVAKLMALPGNKEARNLQRYFMAGATSCDIDKQGRILIPAKLRELAGIEKDMVFVGVLDKIEIWSKKKWDESSAFGSMDEAAEHMAELGLSF